MELRADDLKPNEMQMYFDEETGTRLSLWFGDIDLVIDGITVLVRGLPLLRDEAGETVRFPDKTKLLILSSVEGAKEKHVTGVTVSPKKIERRYSFAQKFEFLYSHIDYEYIPGLWRNWNNGFLTPVYFNMSVLNKYSQNPDYKLDLFSETYGNISRKEDWLISFGINKNNKVIMWLGDIDALPASEKYYLRSENVASDHEIHSEFYEAQIDVQWSEASKQSALFHLRNNLNQCVREKLGFDAYALEGEVSEVMENLHRPVFWMEKHVGPVVESLNRIFVESINSKALKSDIKSIDSSADIGDKGSMKIFQLWLELRLKCEDASGLLSPFYVLYDFRVITAHLISDEKKQKTLKSINSRLGLDEVNKNYEIIFDAIILALSTSYDQIIGRANLLPAQK